MQQSKDSPQNLFPSIDAVILATDEAEHYESPEKNEIIPFNHRLRKLLSLPFQKLNSPTSETLAIMPFRLLALPPELRELILRFATSNPPIQFKQNSSTNLARELNALSPLNLLLTSKQLYIETLPFITTIQLTSYSIPFYYENDLQALLSWLKNGKISIRLLLVEDTWTDTFEPGLARFFAERYGESDAKRTLKVARKLKESGFVLRDVEVRETHDGGVFWERRKRLWEEAVGRAEREESLKS